MIYVVKLATLDFRLVESRNARTRVPCKDGETLLGNNHPRQQQPHYRQETGASVAQRQGDLLLWISFCTHQRVGSTAGRKTGYSRPQCCAPGPFFQRTSLCSTAPCILRGRVVFRTAVMFSPAGCDARKRCTSRTSTIAWVFSSFERVRSFHPDGCSGRESRQTYIQSTL